MSQRSSAFHILTKKKAIERKILSDYGSSRRAKSEVSHHLLILLQAFNRFLLCQHSWYSSGGKCTWSWWWGWITNGRHSQGNQQVEYMMETREDCWSPKERHLTRCWGPAKGTSWVLMSALRPKGYGVCWKGCFTEETCPSNQKDIWRAAGWNTGHPRVMLCWKEVGFTSCEAHSIPPIRHREGCFIQNYTPIKWWSQELEPQAFSSKANILYCITPKSITQVNVTNCYTMRP